MNDFELASRKWLMKAGIPNSHGSYNKKKCNEFIFLPENIEQPNWQAITTGWGGCETCGDYDTEQSITFYVPCPCGNRRSYEINMEYVTWGDMISEIAEMA